MVGRSNVEMNARPLVNWPGLIDVLSTVVARAPSVLDGARYGEDCRRDSAAVSDRCRAAIDASSRSSCGSVETNRKDGVMPVVRIDIVEGRSPDKIEAMLREVASAIATTLDAPIETIRIVVNEVEPHKFAVGGQPLPEVLEARRKQQEQT